MIRKERRGQYLGNTVQVIPHITNEIQDFIFRGAKTGLKDEAEVAIVEVGGTVGDIESLPFLEAIRQMALRLGQAMTCYVHLTLVPFLSSAGELKTKPTQHSVQRLREIGIIPNLILCRADRLIPDDEREKISLFSNVKKEAVVSVSDVDSIYRIPRMLFEQGVDDVICDALELSLPSADLSVWDKLLNKFSNSSEILKVAMVGKYVEFKESYKSLTEALNHAGIHCNSRVVVEYLDAELIESVGPEKLSGFGAILVPGGFGERGIEGKITSIRYARENKIPFLGIHLTKMIDGSITVGPNALQGYKREGYGKLNFNLIDTLEMILFTGFWKVLLQLTLNYFQLTPTLRPGVLASSPRQCTPIIR